MASVKITWTTQDTETPRDRNPYTKYHVAMAGRGISTPLSVREVTFTDVAPGSYVAIVTIMNDDGFSGGSIEIPVTVDAPVILYPAPVAGSAIVIS